MRFLYDNIVGLHVFAVLAVFAWLFGGRDPDVLLPVIPWVTALLLEAMVCFPQHHAGETSYDARERVWSAMRRDPLVWVSFALILLLVFPFVNKSLCPVCDFPAICNGADPKPFLPVLPTCFNRMEHLSVVLWFVPTLVAVVATKHALLKRGKRTLVQLIVWNGVALGLLGMIQQMAGAKAPLWCGELSNYFFSTFGYPNAAGDFFTTLFALAIGLWRWRLEELRDQETDVIHVISTTTKHLADRAEASDGETDETADDGHHHRHHHHHESRPHVSRQFWKKHYYLLPAGFFFFCALDTLSRATIVLVMGLAILFFLHTFIGSLARMHRAQRVKAGFISLCALVLIAVSATVYMPRSLQKEVDSLQTNEMLDRVTGRAGYHDRVAIEIWRDYPFFGCGGWGYKHLCLQYMNEKELASGVQGVGGANVHNDILQFITEHGVVGFGLLVAIVVILLWPMGRACRLMLDSVRFLPPKKQPPQPVQIFIVPAPAFCILAAAAATLIHAFGDCAMRSPAVLSMFFVMIATVDGFFPRLKVEEK